MDRQRKRETWWTLFWIALFVGFLTLPACPEQDDNDRIILRGCPPGHIAHVVPAPDPHIKGLSWHENTIWSAEHQNGDKHFCCVLLRNGTQVWVAEENAQTGRSTQSEDHCDDRGE